MSSVESVKSSVTARSHVDLVPVRNHRPVHTDRIPGPVSYLRRYGIAAHTHCIPGERCAGSPIRANSSSVSTNDDAHLPGQASPDRGVLRQDEKDAAIEQLVERVRQLEHTLSTPSRSSVSEAGTRSQTNIVQPCVGQFVKSKFYGESHWNNVLEPVNADALEASKETDSISTTHSAIQILPSTLVTTGSKLTKILSCTPRSLNASAWHARSKRLESCNLQYFGKSRLSFHRGMSATSSLIATFEPLRKSFGFCTSLPS